MRTFFVNSACRYGTVIAVAVVVVGAVASGPSRAWGLDRSAAKQIAAVENGLDPPVVIAGETRKKWTIAMQMLRLKVPAVSVAVIDDYKIDWAKAWGVTEPGGRKAVTADTLFQAASISKPISAMAAMHLVQEGKLNLDADVNDYLKGWKVPDNEFTRSKPVTLRELLSHSAGIPTFLHTAYRPDATLPTLPQILDGILPADTRAVRVEWVPGSRWQYSNAGYAIVQQMVVDVTGESFPDFMRTTLLQPLGMRHSSYEEPLPAALQTNAAVGTLADGKELPDKWLVYPAMIASGLWTTPSDIARFAIALMNTKRGESNPVISAATGAEILTSQIATAGGLDQGLGVWLQPSPLGTRFSHTGKTPGFATIMIGYLSGRGIIVMTNSDDGAAVALPIIRAVEHVYGWNSYPIAAK
ncbi:MAG: serine hydrolase domain-containing protein [Candidatus Binataceae bacterium]